MARIRSTKPEFWTRGDVLECSPNARQLYKGMENFADDYGNIDAHHKSIKAKVFPNDAFSVDPLIDELIKTEMLQPYFVNGSKYYHLRTFLDDQKIDRPGKPQCPDFDISLMQERSIVELSPIRRDGGEGRGEEKERKKNKTKDHLKSDDPPTREKFEKIWKEYPHKRGKEKAWLKFKKQVVTEEDWVNIQTALTNYIAEVEHKRKNGHSDLDWQHGSTWFNNNWRDYVKMEVPAVSDNPNEWEAIEDRLAQEKVIK